MKQNIKSPGAVSLCQRALAVLFAFIFMLSAAMTGTAAWADLSQHKTNTAMGDGSVKLSDALLQKYERDADGNETVIPVPGAAFTLYRVNTDGTAEEIKSLITGYDGKALAANLKPGDYYWQETRPPYGFLPEIQNGQPKKHPFTISDENGEAVIVTAYNTRINGSLTLTKTVINADNSPLTEEQLEQEFEFIITLNGIADGEIPVQIDGEEKQFSIINCRISINLKSGQTAVIEKLPAGIHYEITETAAEGYSTVSENHAGTVTQDGVAVSFINTFEDSPSPDALTLSVTKRVEGNPPDGDTRTFHFILNIGDKVHEFDLQPGQTSGTFTVYPGESYLLTESDYTADGYIQSGVINGAGVAGSVDIEIVQTNRYIGTETTDIEGEKTWNLNGAPSDTAIPDSITVLLKNGDTTVRTASVGKDGQWKFEFKNLPRLDALGNEILYIVEEVPVPGWRSVVSGYSIENIYRPALTIEGPDVEKTVTGALPPADEIFTFILSPVSGADTPMPNSSELSITGAGVGSFGKITYDIPGTYAYTVTEAHGGAMGWSYDAAVYTLTVTVSEDGSGQLTAVKTLAKNDEAAKKILFTNHYNDGGDIISLRVTKKWEGADSNRPKSVQVQLYKDGAPYGNPAALSDANGWTRVYSGLDALAVWTVDEVTVPNGYTKSISGDLAGGFVITNTSISAPDSGGGTHPSTPKTGDETHLGFWLILLFTSLTALILTVFSWKQKSRAEQYIPKY